jgi:anti-anti-sigma factor
MKRHRRAMAENPPARAGRPLETFAEQIVPASQRSVHQRVDLRLPAPRSLAPTREAEASRRDATHTLVLIGELHRACTNTLEAEIERLCEAGIGAITLDLAQLSGIDAAGVAVIAFRSRWCAKRGCELALVGAAREVQRAFELAGVAGSLRFKEPDARGT